MILGHVIALDPTPEQKAYFRRACGTARYAYNWGLDEWRRMHQAGEKPSANKVKAAWNAHRRGLPWSYDVTKCASAQAIRNLGTAFTNFFRDLKKPRKQRRFFYPTVKRKFVNDSFALWNDQFDLKGQAIRIPKLGWVKMRERLRFEGKILGATVRLRGGRWFVSVQVDTVIQCEPAPAGSVCGVDLGIETLATVSSGNGTVIKKEPNPKPRKRLARRKRRLQKRASKQKARAKKLGIKASRRQRIRQMKVSKLAAREANIRRDAAHQFTTRLARQFETVTLEDLNVRGMSKNHAIAGAILDVAPYEIRRQLEYKTAMRGGRIVVADRFFPSSKMCSVCGAINGSLLLSDRTWTCQHCGAVHDRDTCAAQNLERIGMATPKSTCGDMGASTAREACRKHRDGTANQSQSAHIRARFG